MMNDPRREWKADLHNDRVVSCLSLLKVVWNSPGGRHKLHNLKCRRLTIWRRGAIDPVKLLPCCRSR